MRAARNRSSMDRVAPAATTWEPSATARIAASSSSGRASLSTKPLAPASIADTAASSRSNVVSTSTRGAASPSRSCSRRVAVTPSTRAIRTSMTTTSGRDLLDQARHLVAVVGLPDHLEVGLAVDHHRDAGAEHRLVVDQGDPDRHAAGSGSSARTDPGLAVGCPASKVPPAMVHAVPHARQAVARADASARTVRLGTRLRTTRR